MIIKVLVSMTLGLVTLSTHAALYDRGNGMLFDDQLNITWLQDANYAQTSGYDDNGRMTWREANNWVDNLSYGGFGDWRLPSVRGNPLEGTTQWEIYSAETELGHMYKNNLGWEFGVWHDGIHSPGFEDAASGTKKNLINFGPYGMWYKEDYSDTAVWGFAPSIGLTALPNMNGEYAAWAVRDGDIRVAPVPLPGAIWLFLTAIVGSGVMTLKRKSQK